MQRIYGVAFAIRLPKTYLEMLEEAKKRDHRKLGQELDLFVFLIWWGRGYLCLRQEALFLGGN